MPKLTEELKETLAGKLSALGLELVEVKFISAGPRSILRVFIDSDDGVSVDDCEKASDELSMILEVEEFSKAPYTLEVSSPGLDRVLTKEKEFVRVVGKTVRLRVDAGNEKVDTVEGTLESVVDGKLTLKNGKKEAVVELSRVISGKVEPSFR